MSTTDATSAYSIDGRTFAFKGPATAGIRPGAYVSVATSDGHGHLGQVLDVRAAPGPTFAEPAVEGSGELLSTSDTPLTNATLGTADPASVRSRLAAHTESGGLTIGHLVDVPDVDATLKTSGFGRHTFMCGQSGSGKTYAMGVMLERLLHETSLRMVVLDPNSDYVRMGSLLPKDKTDLDDAGYEAASRRHDEISGRFRVLSDDEEKLRGWLGKFTLRQQATVLGLDPIADAEETNVAMRIIEELGTDQYTPADLRARAAEMDNPAAHRLALRIENLRLERMRIWADSEHPAIVDQLGDDWRTAVLDLGSLPTARERSIVAAAAIGHLWDRRRERQPMLLVIDEAHNVCPQHPTDPNQALATEHLIAIAGEGRKYGLYLLLATQRPTKIHENVLSQCDNLLLMRMNSRADIAHLSTAFSGVAPALIERSATFRLGEGLAAGKIAPDPLLFKTGRRITPEGGSDVPSDWTTIV